jgi:hypothetical protein
LNPLKSPSRVDLPRRTWTHLCSYPHSKTRCFTAHCEYSSLGRLLRPSSRRSTLEGRLSC